MTTKNIISKSNVEINWDKVNRDLNLIRSLQEICETNNWRIVVSGGYGLDILLGRITRTHSDVDIIIFGQESRGGALTKIHTFLANQIPHATFKNSENDFQLVIDLHSPGLGANIYYVQTAISPFTNLNVIIKQNGESITNSAKRFPSPVKGKLDELEIEIQNPHTHLADILYKQRTLTHKPTHDQDISNLRQITDEYVVEEIIKLS
jgi:hypothetical protein